MIIDKTKRILTVSPEELAKVSIDNGKPLDNLTAALRLAKKAGHEDIVILSEMAKTGDHINFRFKKTSDRYEDDFDNNDGWGNYRQLLNYAAKTLRNFDLSSVELEIDEIKIHITK